jgi:hypothetical protein
MMLEHILGLLLLTYSDPPLFSSLIKKCVPQHYHYCHCHHPATRQITGYKFHGRDNTLNIMININRHSSLLSVRWICYLHVIDKPDKSLYAHKSVEIRIKMHYRSMKYCNKGILLWICLDSWIEQSI